MMQGSWFLQIPVPEADMLTLGREPLEPRQLVAASTALHGLVKPLSGSASSGRYRSMGVGVMWSAVPAATSPATWINELLTMVMVKALFWAFMAALVLS